MNCEKCDHDMVHHHEGLCWKQIYDSESAPWCTCGEVPPK